MASLVHSNRQVHSVPTRVVFVGVEYRVHPPGGQIQPLLQLLKQLSIKESEPEYDEYCRLMKNQDKRFTNQADRFLEEKLFDILYFTSPPLQPYR